MNHDDIFYDVGTLHFGYIRAPKHHKIMLCGNQPLGTGFMDLSVTPGPPHFVKVRIYSVSETDRPASDVVSHKTDLRFGNALGASTTCFGLCQNDGGCG